MSRRALVMINQLVDLHCRLYLLTNLVPVRLITDLAGFACCRMSPQSERRRDHDHISCTCTYTRQPGKHLRVPVYCITKNASTRASTHTYVHARLTQKYRTTVHHHYNHVEGSLRRRRTQTRALRHVSSQCN